MSTATGYPVRVDGELEPDLSRWLWLVKWILGPDAPGYAAVSATSADGAP